MKISSQVTNGKLHPAVSATLRKTIAKMEGKYIEVEIKPRRRSLAANRYRWGVVTETVRQAINRELKENNLPEASAEDIDLFIKEKALGIIHRIPTSMGELIIQGRLKNKTTADFEQCMEQIRVYFARKGIKIPLPHENDIEEWYSENLER